RGALRLETVRCRLGSPTLRPSEPYIDRDIDQVSPCGADSSSRPAVQRSQELFRYRAVSTLVGERRVGKSIADHDLALVQRGADNPTHVLCPRREKEQNLGLRRERLLPGVRIISRIRSPSGEPPGSRVRIEGIPRESR